MLTASGNYTTVTFENTDRTERFESFGVTDSKGRVIGCRIRTWTSTYTESGKDSGVCRKLDELGVFFDGEVHATRDGVIFGASHYDPQFRTPAERDAYVAKRIVASRKAALKKAQAVPA